MKSRILTCITAMTLFTAVALRVRLAAQESQNLKPKHHHYKLIDLGTLGGPNSRFSGNVNNREIAVGVSDTTTADPFYPNANPNINTFGADPFVYHAFQWKQGKLIDLGALPGANSSWASWISANGLVAGQSINGEIDPITGWPEEAAILWKNGDIINLGTLGGYESGAGAVNSRGQVTGFAFNAIPDPFSIVYFVFNGFSNGTQTRAFLWENGQMQDLGTLGGPDAFGVYINERGQVIGSAYTNATPNPTTGFPTADPFLWENGRMTDLGTLGGTSGGVSIVNNRGQVVGQSNLAGDLTAHAFRWDRGTLTDLGTPGGSFSTANDINDAGEVVGGGTTAGDQAFHGFFWRHGVLTDLGTLSGHDCSNAFVINSKDQVVGQSFDCNGSSVHAFLWEKGHLTDLNAFVPPGSDLTLVEAVINDRGEIFGNSVLPNGDFHAFLLIPCDDDHPGVEGCDYSMVDAATIAQNAEARKAQTVAPANVHPLMQQRQRMGRFRVRLPIPQ